MTSLIEHWWNQKTFISLHVDFDLHYCSDILYEIVVEKYMSLMCVVYVAKVSTTLVRLDKKNVLFPH